MLKLSVAASTSSRRMVARVLRCNSACIEFNETGSPIFTCKETEDSIRQAAEHIQKVHTPFAFPTETVYGLGAPALIEDAVARIFATKLRPPDNPLIVHISSIDMLHSLLPADFAIPESYTWLMKRFWPGPLSLLFPANTALVPAVVTANHPTVAIRMPSHPVARALVALSASPLAAPSANTSGKPSPTTAEHVMRDLGDRLDLVVDGGPCEVGLESTVIDGLGPDHHLRVLRPGGVTVEDLYECLRDSDSEAMKHVSIKVFRRDYVDKEVEQAPTTPGMKYRHYCPSVPVVLMMSGPPPPGTSSETFITTMSSLIEPLRTITRTPKIGLMLFEDSPILQCLPMSLASWQHFSMGHASDLSIMARRLFAGLLELENAKMDLIIVEGVEEVGEGLAIMNRITKAASEMRWIRLANS
jgi:L-threonylcarbamoyladenylate synthase